MKKIVHASSYTEREREGKKILAERDVDHGLLQEPFLQAPLAMIFGVNGVCDLAWALKLIRSWPKPTFLGLSSEELRPKVANTSTLGPPSSPFSRHRTEIFILSDPKIISCCRGPARTTFPKQTSLNGRRKKERKKVLHRSVDLLWASISLP